MVKYNEIERRKLRINTLAKSLENWIVGGKDKIGIMADTWNQLLKVNLFCLFVSILITEVM